jgi:hypothetical protein
MTACDQIDLAFAEPLTAKAFLFSVTFRSKPRISSLCAPPVMRRV